MKPLKVERITHAGLGFTGYRSWREEMYGLPGTWAVWDQEVAGEPPGTEIWYPDMVLAEEGQSRWGRIRDAFRLAGYRAGFMQSM